MSILRPKYPASALRIFAIACYYARFGALNPDILNTTFFIQN